ncbi:MAG TPA: hypothetical protein VGG75_07460 [Trebonia sp.]|jgi:crotonobetainyl-CoA:carnitine CoA-transferase CaiB-like acyl-CoA transferase
MLLADLGAEVIRVDRPGANSPRCRRRAPTSPAAASAASSSTARGEPKARLFGPVRAA